MPFTAPQYVGGQLWASGLQSFGQSIAGALENYQKQHEAQLQAEQLAQALTSTPGYDGKPILSQSAYERLMATGSGQHAARVAGLLSALKLGQEAGSQGVENRLKTAQANYYTMRGAAEGPESQFDLSPEERAAYSQAGRVPLRTSKKTFQVAEAPDTIDVDNGGNPIYSEDKAMYRSGGKWKPTTEAMRKSMEDYEAAQQAQKAAAEAKQQETGGARWYNPLSWFGSPSQGPTPTPPARVAPTIQAPAPGAAPSPAGGGNAATASEIKARYRAGEITREEAKAQLAAIGYQ